MQQQFQKFKQQYPEHIVLFRLGDFYETFEEDAHTASQVLGITLTGRGKGDNRTPMAGIPYHALDNYLPRLVRQGYKVVVVEQTSQPEQGKIVEREVAKIYTAGTLTEENTLSESQNNYLVSINTLEAKQNRIYAIAYADVSTGEIQAFATASKNLLDSELERIDPVEILVSENDDTEIKIDAQITKRPQSEFNTSSNYTKITEQFGTHSLKGYGLEQSDPEVGALGALVNYLEECQRTTLNHIKSIRRYTPTNYMQLDASTIRNLELVYPNSGDDFKATVYHQLNLCRTNMGKRKLRYWLLHPLTAKDELVHRWDAVTSLQTNLSGLSSTRELLEQVADIERITARIGVGTANARDLLALATSLKSIEQLVNSKHIGDKEEILLQAIEQQLSKPLIQELASQISHTLQSEPPIALTEGNLIAPGINREVDELRELKSGGKQSLAEIQAREIKKTGITSLRVSYNRVFGYYIEITNKHADRVPVDYIRKQTLTNSERYITQELKDWEHKILSAQEKLEKLEYELFLALRNEISGHSQELLALADKIAELDVLANFAHLSREYRYNRPQLSETEQLIITAGRHPVIERIQPEFTPNDIHFDSKSRIVILTGPNMSGKSTYIRQVALITLLAQIGCFVPAKEMKFKLVDRIFTRVGAGDNLSKGESTFMVEMNETANIMNNATQNSLIILDEVGRGTSTYDGVSIAWSVVEYIASEIQAYTLFATHYHELVDLEPQYETVINYNVEVTEKGSDILFTHKIKPGGTSKSYGIHVAEMAGIPEQILTRAHQILDQLEDPSQAQKSKPGQNGTKKAKPRMPKSKPAQLKFLD